MNDTTPTDIDTEGLRALAAKATPGPWLTWNDGHVGNPEAHIGGIVMPTNGSDPDKWMPDARLIVAAVNNLPALLDALDTAREDLPKVWSMVVPHGDWQEVVDELRAMTAERDALRAATPSPVGGVSDNAATVLAEHRWDGAWGDNDDPETGKFFRCTCGWTHRVDGMNGWDSWRARHDEHVVAVLAAHGGDA